MSIIRDKSLAPDGRLKIDWASATMPVLKGIRSIFEEEKPLKGLRITVSIHLEAKTAYFAETLRAGGAEVYVTGCNPLSTQDDVAAALCDAGLEVFGIRGADDAEYENHLAAALSCRPHIIVDDGGDLTSLLHGKCANLADELIAGSEETTTGVTRLRAMERGKALKFPMVAVNDANCKYLFDNRYGTGQSVLTAVMDLTNRLIAGKTVVVAGYGWCGRGIALRAKAMGARVIVTEINPIRALEAAMDGFGVARMEDAARQGEFFITATGCKDVIRREHMELMRDEAVLCNAGHFDVEISRSDLEAVSCEEFPRRDGIVGYRLRDGRVLNLLVMGRLVNLAGGKGHPSEIMDMSFSLQALTVSYLAEKGKTLAAGVYNVPEELDRRVSELKLRSMGLGIDTLSEEQRRYLGGAV